MQKPTMAFIRRFDGRILGGHLKFFDYIRHVAASSRYQPVLYVTPESTHLDDEIVGMKIARITSLREADAYFVGGLDWRILLANNIDPHAQPVVNLIQGFIHTRPDDARRSFLSLPAFRVCVSETLREALLASGPVNGPVVCVENATDVQPVEKKAMDRSKIFIGGMKSPDVAREIATALRERGVEAHLQTEVLPREAYLACLRAASIAVLLPLEHDGFFLPALEAMALGCAVVVPDIAGTRSYCINEETALTPAYRAQSIVAATMRLHENQSDRERLSENGIRRAALHSPKRERDTFLKLLSSYADNWHAVHSAP